MAASNNPTSKRIQFYREFLTPALHRRFTRAAGVLLLACYAESILIRDKSSWIWLLFPIGPAGITTLLLFFIPLVTFLLRVANLHFGERITASPASTFLQTLLTGELLSVFASYLFCAWWFSEVYVWSAPARLRWVVEGEHYEPVRLNEWPIYLRCHFLTIGFIKALGHIVTDANRVPLLPPRPADAEEKIRQEIPPGEQLRAAFGTTFVASMNEAFFLAISSLFTYVLFLRSFVWEWSLWFARWFWKIPGSADPPDYPPYHYTVLVRSFTAGLLLIFLFAFSNKAFNVYVAQMPVKARKNTQSTGAKKPLPLTEDARDPNGSLLTGLKSKKEGVREFAFWELLYISLCDDARRKSIYCEIDRKDGSTWSQLLKASLSIIEDIAVRIAHKGNPAAKDRLRTDVKVERLPQLSEPLREGQIIRPAPKASNRTELLEDAAGDFAKSIGQSPGTPAQNVLALILDRLLSDNTKRTMDWEHLQQSSKGFVTKALSYQIAAGIRETFASSTKMVILGSPRSDLRPILLSINSVTQLTLAGVKEDIYGTVSKDVALIFRTFANMIDRIDRFMRETPIPWSDVKFQDGDGREMEEIELLLYHLRIALRELLGAYEKYATDMGLRPAEIREAKRAALLPTD